MRNITLFVVFVFFGLNIKAQSLQSFGLKGHVKSIEENCNECSKDIHGVKQCFFHEMNYTFSDNGKYIKPEDKILMGEYSKEKKSTANGFIVSTFRKVDGGVLKDYDQYYDDKDLLIKTVHYDKDGNIKDEYNSFYTENNVREKVIHISYDNGLTKTMISYYDKYGNFSGDETYQGNKLVEKRKFEMNYEFDSYGNWTYKYVDNGKYTLIHNREITYYKNKKNNSK